MNESRRIGNGWREGIASVDNNRPYWIGSNLKEMPSEMFPSLKPRSSTESYRKQRKIGEGCGDDRGMRRIIAK